MHFCTVMLTARWKFRVRVKGERKEGIFLVDEQIKVIAKGNSLATFDFKLKVE